MRNAKYLFMILGLLIFPRCTTVESSPPAPTINPKELLLSREDMPLDWKSYSVFSDEYDDWCYIDCAIIQFSPVDRDGVYAEQSIYVYYTIEEAQRNYEDQLLPSQPGTTPSSWSYKSNVAVQSNLACYTYYTSEGVASPGCSWIAQYGKYLVFFVVHLVPEKMSLTDLEKIIERIDSRMEVVANESQ
jgi:hypothetical protein